ncbi:3018_t:CDS:2, partial [Cetraspora pellucida]
GHSVSCSCLQKTFCSRPICPNGWFEDRWDWNGIWYRSCDCTSCP